MIVTAVLAGPASAAINGRSDMRKCNACTSSFSLFSAELLKDNGSKANFFRTKRTAAGPTVTVSQLSRACEKAHPNWSSRHLKSCDSFGNLMMNTAGLIPLCWNKHDAGSFCGCIVKGGRGNDKCPVETDSTADAGDAEDDEEDDDAASTTAAGADKDKDDDAIGLRGNSGRGRGGRGASSTPRPAGAISDRFVRQCLGCEAAFSVVEPGVNMDTNMDKSRFFATRTGSGSNAGRSEAMYWDIHDKCMEQSVDGESSRRRKRVCGSVAKLLTNSAVISQCWDKKTAKGLCGCAEGAGRGARDKVCP